jgi:hypothetical protein
LTGNARYARRTRGATIITTRSRIPAQRATSQGVRTPFRIARAAHVAAATPIDTIGNHLGSGSALARRPPGVKATPPVGWPNPSGYRTASSRNALGSQTRNGTTTANAIAAAIAATRRPPVVAGMRAKRGSTTHAS